MTTRPQMSAAEFEDLLSKFGQADYSPEFWASVRKHVREESERYEAEERLSMLANQQLMNKMYTI